MLLAHRSPHEYTRATRMHASGNSVVAIQTICPLFLARIALLLTRGEGYVQAKQQSYVPCILVVSISSYLSRSVKTRN